MKKAIITFSFDDARADSYRAIKLAMKYGVKSTLNVTTGYVDNKNKAKENPTYLPAMSKENVIDLYETGTEIACHGNTHDNKIENILKGKAKLFEWLQLPDKVSIGFASPHSMIDINTEMIGKMKNNNIVYLRVGPFIKSLSIAKRLIRKLATITKSTKLFCYFYRDVIRNPVIDNYILCSIPIMRQNSYLQLKAIVDAAIANKSWVILMFHSVLDKGEDGYIENFSWPLGDYKKLCEYIQQRNNDIDCLTTIEVFHDMKLD